MAEYSQDYSSKEHQMPKPITLKALTPVQAAASLEMQVRRLLTRACEDGESQEYRQTLVAEDGRRIGVVLRLAVMRPAKKKEKEPESSGAS